MPRSGDGRALTKHEPIDSSLRCRLDIEEPTKIDHRNIEKMLEPNPFIISSEETIPRRPAKEKEIGSIKENSGVVKLGRVARKLYGLEPTCEPEKPLKIELDLYQMEDF